MYPVNKSYLDVGQQVHLPAPVLLHKKFNSKAITSTGNPSEYYMKLLSHPCNQFKEKMHRNVKIGRKI